MKKEYYLIIILILVSLASFGMGRMSVLDKINREEEVEFIIPELSSIIDDFSSFSYLASVNGTKYYKRGCRSANRIKEENRIYFKTYTDAIKSGYDASSTC